MGLAVVVGEPASSPPPLARGVAQALQGSTPRHSRIRCTDLGEGKGHDVM